MLTAMIGLASLPLCLNGFPVLGCVAAAVYVWAMLVIIVAGDAAE